MRYVGQISPVEQALIKMSFPLVGNLSEKWEGFWTSQNDGSEITTKAVGGNYV